MLYNYKSLYPQHLITNYVDLDLPSGTLWCKFNFGATEESCKYEAEREAKTYGALLNWDTANNLGNLPTIEQYEELFQYTKRQFVYLNHTNFIRFICKNGKYILFPFAGFGKTCDGVYENQNRCYAESISYMWVKSEIDNSRAHCIKLSHEIHDSNMSLTYSNKNYLKTFRTVL